LQIKSFGLWNFFFPVRIVHPMRKNLPREIETFIYCYHLSFSLSLPLSLPFMDS
jgi:hypothetical protein